MDRVIVGYDGSDGAERALERAAELAGSPGATLLVVSVSRSSRLAEAVPVVEFAEEPVPAIPGPAGTVAPMPAPAPEPPRPEPLELAQHQLERVRMSSHGCMSKPSTWPRLATRPSGCSRSLGNGRRI
jgi:nucleotide-binding universal stress UspA family protein